MTATVVERIERPPEDVVESLRGVSTADLHEAMGKTNAMAPPIAPVTDETTLCGPAVTLTLPEGDNGTIHLAAKLADPGDVLVIATNSTRAASWGELATRNALDNGIEGVVSDGNVRDVDRIDDLGFPVFSRTVSQIGAVKHTPGSVNVPVGVGDVVVYPGDVVVGDGDGVTVVPRTRARSVLAALEARVETEEAIRERIDAGEELFDVLLGEEFLAGDDVETVEGPIDYPDHR
jgi:4-hydroxy-4-methyl-2-oxoglutarate aldolase